MRMSTHARKASLLPPRRQFEVLSRALCAWRVRGSSLTPFHHRPRPAPRCSYAPAAEPVSKGGALTATSCWANWPKLLRWQSAGLARSSTALTVSVSNFTKLETSLSIAARRLSRSRIETYPSIDETRSPPSPHWSRPTAEEGAFLLLDVKKVAGAVALCCTLFGRRLHLTCEAEFGMDLFHDPLPLWKNGMRMTYTCVSTPLHTVTGVFEVRLTTKFRHGTPPKQKTRNKNQKREEAERDENAL